MKKIYFRIKYFQNPSFNFTKIKKEKEVLRQLKTIRTHYLNYNIVQ